MARLTPAESAQVMVFEALAALHVARLERLDASLKARDAQAAGDARKVAKYDQAIAYWRERIKMLKDEVRRRRGRLKVLRAKGDHAE